MTSPFVCASSLLACYLTNRRGDSNKLTTYVQLRTQINILDFKVKGHRLRWQQGQISTSEGIHHLSPECMDVL